MAYGLTFRLELEDGTPADPPTFRTAVPAVEGGRHDPLGTRTFGWLAYETTTVTNFGADR